MNDLTLILWIALYPLVLAIDDYYTAKKKAITKEKKISKDAELLEGLITLVIYIAVTIKLWN